MFLKQLFSKQSILAEITIANHGPLIVLVNRDLVFLSHFDGNEAVKQD